MHVQEVRDREQGEEKKGERSRLGRGRNYVYVLHV